MTKILAITIVFFGLLGMSGGGAGQAHAKPCPEVQLLTVPTDPETQTCASDPDPGAAPPAPLQILGFGAGASQSRDALTFTASVETLFVGPFSAQIRGSGRGLFFDKRDPVPELTHYRARLRLTYAPLGRLWLVPIVQAGMTELRAGPQSAGYLPGRGSSRELALGPGVGVALQILWPLGRGFELVGDIHLEAAWIPGAGDLVLPQAELQPALAATVGIGF